MKNATIIRNIYILIFISLILWAYFAYYTMSEQIQTQRIYATIINLSGKQRMLSQKTTLMAKRVYESNDLILINHSNELIDTMKEDHEFITNNLTSQNMKNIYFKEPYNLDKNVKEYFVLLDEFKTNKNENLLNKIQEYSFELLPKLNHAVYAFEKESEIGTKELLNRELYIFLGTIFTLLIELVFIVIPLLKQMKKKEKDLLELNKSLEKRVKKEISEQIKKDKIILEQMKISAMGEVLQNISHHWRQPLSVITTAASGIKIKSEIDDLSKDEINSFTNQIIKNSNHLSQTIEDFRNFFVNGKKKEDFTIMSILEQSLNLISSRISNLNVKIVNNIDSEVSINGYKKELMQVFLNILNNSLDILEKIDNQDRIIIINNKLESDVVFIEFLDSGNGISNKVIDKIFDPYFTTKHKINGNGLGLYMSYEIITKHFNGKIHVKNHEFNYEKTSYLGANFKIELPKAVN